MNKNKEFDTVLMMREIREELSEKYWKRPDILKKEMQAIRDKYNLNLKSIATNKSITASGADTAQHQQ